MALSHSLTGTPSVEVLDLTVLVIDDAEYPDFEAQPGPNNDENLQDYTFRFVGGSGAYPFSVATHRAYNPKRDRTSNSVRVSATLTTTSTLNDEIESEMLEAVIAWNHDGKFVTGTPQSCLTLIGMAFGIIAQELTGANGLPTTKVLAQFDANVVSRAIPV